MESMTNRLHQNGHTLDSDPQNRLSRPRGRLGENLGSTQFTRSSVKASKRVPKTTKPESDDELDCFSQSSQHSDAPNSWTDVVQGSAKLAATVDGKLHQYDPRFPPGKDEILKKLKIKKNKPSEDRKEPRRTPSSQPLREKSPNRVQPVRTQAVQLPAKPKPKPRPIKKPSPLDPPELLFFNQLDIHSSPPDVDQRQKPHPFPPISPLASQKQVRKLHPPEREDGDPSKPKRAGKSKPPASESDSLSELADDSRSKPRKSKKTGRVKRTATKDLDSSSNDDDWLRSKKGAAATFPILSPLSSPEDDMLSSSAARDFPDLSPLGSHDAKPFPAPSPLVNRRMSKGKGKAKEDPVEISDTEDRRTPKTRAQPFPMSTQFLEGIGSSPMATPKAGSSHNKRLSDGNSERGSKKRRGLDNSPQFEDADTTLSYLDSYADPSTLCPYCDQSLPRNPTPLLKRLLSVAATNSTKDPRPTNALGRKAPFTNFISVCRRHHFETEVLPEAEAKGWPKVIDWDEIEGRVKRMRKDLKALIDDHNVSSISDFEDEEDEDLWSTGPRSRCVFWREVMRDVKKKGSKVVAGVRSQFANFEKTQPGYYGELGSVIILQTLYNLFPPASFDPTSIKPLNPAEFIQRILVPEVGLRLIMEDKSLSGFSGAREALGILRESASYGVSMFPEDEGEWGVVEAAHKRKEKVIDGMRLGVADRMALDRARKRRKELEAEEAEERAAETLESDVSEVQAQGSRTRKKKKREEVLDPPSSTRPPRPQPNPRPVKQPDTALKIPISKSHSRLSPAAGMDSGDDNHRVDQQPISISSDSEPASIARSKKSAMSTSLDADLSSDLDSKPDNRATRVDAQHREPRGMDTPGLLPLRADKPLEQARKRLEQRERTPSDRQSKKGFSWLLSESQSDCSDETNVIS